MLHEILLAPEAVEDLKRLKAVQRSQVKRAMEAHLRHGPKRMRKCRIKRLRGLSRPQYRLRVGDLRVFYDVSQRTVEVLAVVSKAEAEAWCRRQVRRMKRVALSEAKDDLSRFLRLAEKEEVLITRHGKPAGLLIGFETEEDWFGYRLEADPRFLARVEAARRSLRAGRGVKLEDLEE
jgi:prevent-host-death family protein